MSARLFPSPLMGEGARRAGEGGTGKAGHPEYTKVRPLIGLLTNRLSPQAGKSLVIPNPSPLMSRRDGIPWGKGEGLQNKEIAA